MQALAPTPRPRPSHGPVPPLGVHLAGDGVDVAVLASHASAVDLCLLDVSPDGEIHERRVSLDGPSYGVWHARVPGVREGQRYGFRAHGPWDPAAGLRYNPAKLLLDPYARGLVGELDEDPSTRGHVTERDASGVLVGDPEGPADLRDSATHVPHSVVVAPRTNHPPVRRPQVPWADTVLYEAHVRGLTMQLEAVPEPLRGTYAGLAHPATIAHLRDLGVTTIELLPIHAFLSEPHLVAQDLTNYWGYSTAGFFAPHAPYATRDAQEAGPGAVVDEVRGMVHLLHEAGIEVVLDVVHNHTCEGGVDGPHLSWRGLDNPVHYLHDGATPARLADVTGTGNSLDFRRARVVQATLDSLRYWAQEIGVDGFRFDLAVTLGRGPGGFDPDHPFLVALQTDPVLNGLKLIAEPWDVGPGGWRTGQFPAPLAEWNDRFRGAVRQFWLADPREASHGRLGQGVRELATRLAGSADLFGHSDPPLMRGPVASINFVTAHDGFTLADLVAYEHKHNEANGEGNRDGSDDNRSWNHGIEGRLSDEDATIRGLEHGGFEPGLVIAPLRRRSIRNLMATQILAAGTPMLTAGDEMGRTQRGNNNAYCQDGPLSWVSWDLSPWRKDLLATTTHLLALRREHAALRSDAFFHGRPRHAAEDAVPDLAWFDAAGHPLDHDAWHDPGFRVLQMLRTGPGEEDKDVLVVVNGALDTVEVTPAAVPGRREGGAAGCAWELAWDSDWEHPTEGEHGVDGIEGGEGTASADPAFQADPAGSPSVLLEPLSMQVYVSAERP
ncbi:glycogen debranching protein GlgX [Oerskovia enterophila]|uniref:Glycogen debranching enzyme n=1 Tax=Oerskovia enterophila TaxID=43678 RepID=A0A161XH12_9CELL|nr:glycogen debranching protein GlgX [Oerskovia enterophila]KZM36117.1 glycogen debranching enzyme [Oerskovia enterophila]